jgi:hypothetical protein
MVLKVYGSLVIVDSPSKTNRPTGLQVENFGQINGAVLAFLPP